MAREGMPCMSSDLWCGGATRGYAAWLVGAAETPWTLRDLPSHSQRGSWSEKDGPHTRGLVNRAQFGSYLPLFLFYHFQYVCNHILIETCVAICLTVSMSDSFRTVEGLAKHISCGPLFVATTRWASSVTDPVGLRLLEWCAAGQTLLQQFSLSMTPPDWLFANFPLPNARTKLPFHLMLWQHSGSSALSFGACLHCRRSFDPELVTQHSSTSACRRSSNSALKRCASAAT